MRKKAENINWTQTRLRARLRRGRPTRTHTNLLAARPGVAFSYAAAGYGRPKNVNHASRVITLIRGFCASVTNYFLT